MLSVFVNIEVTVMIQVKSNIKVKSNINVHLYLNMVQIHIILYLSLLPCNRMLKTMFISSRNFEAAFKDF